MKACEIWSGANSGCYLSEGDEDRIIDGRERSYLDRR